MSKITNFYKDLRIVTVFLNFKYFKKLKKNRKIYKKLGIKNSVVEPLSYNSIRFHDTNYPWMDKEEVTTETIKASPAFNSFSPYIQEKILEWRENGYIILSNFFDPGKIEQVEQSVLESIPEKDRPEYFANRSINLHKNNPKVAEIFKDKTLLSLLSFLLGKEVIPFQTINFYKSSSQKPHSDSFHLSTEPLGYLLAVSVALEDVTPGSGEFIYYPGSHTLPYTSNRDVDAKNNIWRLDPNLNDKYEKKVADMIEENKLEVKKFYAKKGDIIIWHANLLHGSAEKKDASLSRKSLVMHYLAKDVLCYHESSERPAVMDQ